MPKSTRSVVFSVIVLAATSFTLYFLNQLDQIVHGQLYNYGLVFNYAWADPYWNILKIIQILLAVAAGATGINLALSIKKDISKKPTLTQRPQKTTPQMSTMPRTVERQTIPPQRPATLNAPVIRQTNPPSQIESVAPIAPAARTPTPQQFPPETSGPTRCPHCGKAFTQPLRMLDFQGDRPRIVNICPFCNEIIQTATKQESQEDERFLLRRKNNNHTSKTTPSQQTS
jgi:hypothetical protein